MVGMASLVGMAGAAVLANAGRHAAWLQALAEGEGGQGQGGQAPALAQPPPPPPPAPKPQPGGSRPPSGAVAAAVALALSNARRMGQAQGTCAATPGAHGAGAQARIEESALELSGAKGAKWSPHELEVLVRAVRLLGHRTTQEDTRRILAELGWPVTVGTRLRLRNKVATLRAHMLHGRDPEEVLHKRRSNRNTGATYKAWAVAALRVLPGGQGTLEEISAAFLADPNVAPKLDCRPSTRFKTVPQWRAALSATLLPSLGFFNSGAKRGGRVVYGYDPQAAASARPAPTPRKGQPGLPYLGKRSRNAN